MSPDEIAAKFGGVAVGNADAIAAKFGGAPAERAPNSAEANPEVMTPFGTIQGEAGASGFNPAAALIGTGDWLAKLNRGFIQMRDAPVEYLTGKTSPQLAAARKSAEFAAEPMKKLEEVNPGSVMLGRSAIPAILPPGMLPMLGATEEGSVAERTGRAGAAAAGYGLTKAAGSYLAGAPARAEAAKATNAVRDEVVQRAQEAGFAFPPSAVGNTGPVTKSLEGMLAGKAKTEQLATVKNQPLSDALMRAEVKLSSDAPLTPETLAAVRKTAYDTGYKPVASLQSAQADIPFIDGLLSLKPQSAGGAVRNPAAKDIGELVDDLANQVKWTGPQLVRDIQSLREQARALANSAAVEGGNAGKSELARAKFGAADMLEQLAERNIIAQGGQPGAVAALREARTLIAKSHDIEDSLVNGSVDALKLGGKLGKEATGNMALLRDIAKDKAMRKSVAMPVAGANNPVTAMDGLSAAVVASIAGPLAAVGAPAARASARYAILSKPYQQMFAKPNYGQSLVSRGAPLLDNPYAPAALGMYGYAATSP